MWLPQPVVLHSSDLFRLNGNLGLEQVRSSQTEDAACSISEGKIPRLLAVDQSLSNRLPLTSGKVIRGDTFKVSRVVSSRQAEVPVEDL